MIRCYRFCVPPRQSIKPGVLAQFAAFAVFFLVAWAAVPTLAQEGIHLAQVSQSGQSLDFAFGDGWSGLRSSIPDCVSEGQTCRKRCVFGEKNAESIDQSRYRN